MLDRVLRSRAAALVFLAAVVGFTWLGLRGRMDEVLDALVAIPVWAVALALACVAAGVLCTAQVWLRLMARLDAPMPQADGQAVFFVGQLGKYIPGSVWAIGVQAELARRHQVPPRSTFAAGLVFLGYNVATAILVAAAACAAGVLDATWPTWVNIVVILGALLGTTPVVVNRLGGAVARRPLAMGWSDTALVLGLQAITWTTYGAALVLLSPGRPWTDLLALGGAFAAAYAVGVVVVFAPAGLGAREAVLVLLLTPLLGVGAATAVALLARVLHTAVDALAAGGSWLRRTDRRATARCSHPPGPRSGPAPADR